MGAAYKGELELLYSAVHFIANPTYDYVVVCDSAVLCNIDFREVLKQQHNTGHENR